jgi:hypothetical protein
VHEPSNNEDSDVYDEDTHHVTQVSQIMGRRGTISKAVSGFIPRSLSRARSANVLRMQDGSMVVGVSVERATVDGQDEELKGSTVHAPGSLSAPRSPTRLSFTNPAGENGLLKTFLRRKRASTIAVTPNQSSLKL